MSDVKAAHRTLDLFETFATVQKPLPLLQLAHALEIPQSSCFALVRTLLSRGYLYEVAPRAGYYPSRRLFDRAGAIAAADPVVTRLGPHLRALRDETGETIVLAKRQQHQAVYLDVVESLQTIRYAMPVGTLKPLHTTSVGKALLSTLAPAARARLLREAGLTRFTERTLTGADALEADIADAQARGWFGNFGESVADVGAVAVPVALHGDWYAIAVAGPEHRIRAWRDAHGAALAALSRRLAETEADETAGPH